MIRDEDYFSGPLMVVNDKDEDNSSLRRYMFTLFVLVVLYAMPAEPPLPMLSTFCAFLPGRVELNNKRRS